MKILADAHLPDLESAFPPPWEVTLYHNRQELLEKIDDHGILICRSTLKVDAHLLDKTAIKIVATASSGSDHFDKTYLRSRNIEMLDAKGCNAVAVADYVTSCLAWLDQQRLLQPGIAGVVGLGAVGSLVLQRLQALGWEVRCYDPLKALNNPDFKSCAQEELYDCSLLCLHAELHAEQPYPSLNLVNQAFLARLKAGTVVINASRGNLVNEEDWLSMDSPIIYCTDVYASEPDVNPLVIAKAKLCTPHIAGHSVEGKYKAVAILSAKLHGYYGLPLPTLELPPFRGSRISATSWPERTLALYNPYDETLKLKEAEDKKEMFSRLRSAHHFRHDFERYD